VRRRPLVSPVRGADGWRADVKRFVTARRFEAPSLHGVLQGLRVSDCVWLAPGPADDNKKGRQAAKGARPHAPPSDMRKRRELLEELVFWYFDSFVLPLLKVCARGAPVPAAARLTRARRRRST
jgi:hypothetical protein